MAACATETSAGEGEKNATSPFGIAGGESAEALALQRYSVLISQQTRQLLELLKKHTPEELLAHFAACEAYRDPRFGFVANLLLGSEGEQYLTVAFVK